MTDYYIYIHGHSHNVQTMQEYLMKYVQGREEEVLLPFKAIEKHSLGESISKVKHMVSMDRNISMLELESSHMFVIGHFKHDHNELDVNTYVLIRIVEVSRSLYDLLNDEIRFTHYLKLVKYMSEYVKKPESRICTVKEFGTHIFEVRHVLSNTTIIFKNDMKTIIIDECECEENEITYAVNLYQNRTMKALDVSIRNKHIVFKTTDWTTIFFEDVSLYTFLFKMCMN